MKRAAAMALGIGVMLSAQAADNASGAEDVLVLSKMAGVCGVMQQMVAFQKSTKMPGGDEFIVRFWRTEFARLGKSQDQFIKECEGSIAAYEEMRKLSEIKAP